MSIAESILPEFDHETATTRLLLERIPDGKADWKPHEHAMTLGGLAMHIANIPKWCVIALERLEFDPNPVDGGRPAVAAAFDSTAQLLRAYDEAATAARALLARTTDGEFMAQWTLKIEGRTMFSMPRVAAFRSFVVNHAAHHRGQLSVYLALLGVPVPHVYHPAAEIQI
jgi:uncharacterized damage-inducible protein DinB